MSESIQKLTFFRYKLIAKKTMSAYEYEKTEFEKELAKMDDNKDGAVDKEEMTKCLMELQKIICELYVDEMFALCDANNDGKVTFAEYEKAVEKCKDKTANYEKVQ